MLPPLRSEVAKKCCASLYEHGSFNGWRATYPVGDYPFRAFKARGARNDKASSIRVSSKGCP